MLRVPVNMIIHTVQDKQKAAHTFLRHIINVISVTLVNKFDMFKVHALQYLITF